MSTINTAQLGEESDGEDQEYIPSPRARGKRRASDSGSSVSGSDTDEPAKRIKLDAELKELAEERRRAALEKLREFDRDDDSSESQSRSVEPRVVIKRARRFAGETIFETVELKASDPEAIAYLAKESAPAETPAPNEQSAAKTSTNPSPKLKPGRRKPRASLEAMSAAMSKGKKMSTLEKSQMDWNAHTTADGHVDELDKNRKGGGYLERQAFLERVSDRRQK